MRGPGRMGRIALLFDLDGTLVDTDLLHHAAFATILGERGETLSLEDYRRHIMGKSNAEIHGRYFPGSPEACQAVADRKEKMFRASLSAEVEPVAGIHRLLDWAEQVGAASAVVTNAPRDNAEAILAAAGLTARLPVVVLADDCARPKPDPAPYREAMRRLGVTPSGAVAFEDSRSGIRAARGSGARVFGVATGLTPAELREAGAHATITDFTDPALWAHLESRTP